MTQRCTCEMSDGEPGATCQTNKPMCCERPTDEGRVDVADCEHCGRMLNEEPVGVCTSDDCPGV